MRVALDATPLALSSGGLRRYVEELSRALAATFPDDHFLLASDQVFGFDRAPNLTACERPRGLVERRWWLFGLNRELERRSIDVFHGTNFEVPYLPRRASVITVHDLSPWMDPSWHAAAGRVKRRVPLLLRLGLATMVITDSKAVRRQVLDRFRIAPDRVVAIPLAPALTLHAGEPSLDREGAVLASPPYFLFLGTIEPRKNIPMLIDAWRSIRSRAPVDLVIAGRTRADAPRLAPEPGLKLLGEVSDEQLSALYSGAVACVYPSLYEGFGLPVIEAMSCGAMVIASRDPAISEFGEGAIVQVDARDARGWADAMLAAATQPEWAAGWRARALARAQEYSWTRTAQRTREVYEEAMRRHGR